MDALLLGCYFLLVAVLSLHGAHRLMLVWLWWTRREPSLQRQPIQEWPRVTVQLPVFNERDVVTRLIDAAAALRWPLDRLQLQVLDDSTDDTVQIVEAAVVRARSKGLDVQVLHRSVRQGFKAGALQAAMPSATGEFIAIFDADFVPDPGFLERLMPDLQCPEVGMVQARWTHLNAGHSPVTEAQALLLDGHFGVEHPARFRAGFCIHFNGTGGIWRRECLDAGGGWQADTLTEDLDLSYRAQLAGWRFVYRLEEEVPGELPETLSAFRSQQARWARGSIQTFRKLRGAISRSDWSWPVKGEAFAHLSANLAWPMGLGIAVLLPAVAAINTPAGPIRIFLNVPTFLLSTGANVLYYLVANPRRWRTILPAIALGVGMSVNQSLAVWEGLWGTTGSFVRTPKSGGHPGSYRAVRSRTTEVELLLAVWNLWGAFQAAAQQHWGIVPFLVLFAAGFGWTGWEALREQRLARSALLPAMR